MWLFTSESSEDSIMGNNLTVGETVAIYNCYDHLGELRGCVGLNKGYYTIPTDVYFNSEFTLTAWVKPDTDSDKYSRIVEFGNGKANDNVILMMNSDSTSTFYPQFCVVHNSNTQKCIGSSTALSLNNWNFIAATFTSTQANIYVSGILSGSISYSSFLPANINRSRNYVAGSSWGGSNTESSIDDIRIYNRALSASEILDLKDF